MLEESVQADRLPTRRPHRLFAASLAAAIEVAVAWRSGSAWRRHMACAKPCPKPSPRST
jgi:hypothetical protein